MNYQINQKVWVRFDGPKFEPGVYLRQDTQFPEEHWVLFEGAPGKATKLRVDHSRIKPRYEFGDPVTTPDGKKAVYNQKATAVSLGWCYVLVEGEGSDGFDEVNLTPGWPKAGGKE